MSIVNLFLRQLLLVKRIPGIDNVGQHEGNEQADDGHRAQGELTAAGVGNGQRRLQIGSRGIVGRVVPC